MKEKSSGNAGDARPPFKIEIPETIICLIYMYLEEMM